MMSDRKKRRIRSQNWTPEETRTLLERRHEIAKDQGPEWKIKATDWRLISGYLEERGFDKTPRQCEVKFNNLLRGFKKTIELQNLTGETGKGFVSEEVFQLLNMIVNIRDSSFTKLPKLRGLENVHDVPIKRPPRRERSAFKRQMREGHMEMAHPTAMRPETPMDILAASAFNDKDLLQEIYRKQTALEGALRSIGALVHKTFQNQVVINQNVEFLINTWREMDSRGDE